MERWKYDERPSTRDGRNVDETLGTLMGEGSAQRIEQLEKYYPAPEPSLPPADRLAAQLSVGEPTYYGLPVIKEPVWKWYVPAYFYAGGAAGGALVLGAAAQWRPSLAPLVRRCRRLGAIGCAVGGALLIADLGRPSRFINMMRVFRPTSPMNLGTWVLSAAGGGSAIAALLDGRRGSLGRLGNAAGAFAGLAGLPLSGYTAVLIANSAVPIWNRSRRTLPLLFVASAFASATSLLDFAALDRRGERVTKRLGVIAKSIELASTIAVEIEASTIPRVGRPLRRGVSGALWNAGRALSAASLVTSLLPGRARWKRALAGALGTAGALSLRFALAQAGKASARDPRATFDSQRLAKIR